MISSWHWLSLRCNSTASKRASKADRSKGRSEPPKLLHPWVCRQNRLSNEQPSFRRSNWQLPEIGLARYGVFNEFSYHG
jgi:hypothetical protein